MPELGLGLGLWSDDYAGIPRLWMRWYDEQGEWVLTEAKQERRLKEESEQRAEQERTRAEQSDQRAEQADQRAELERRQLEELIAKLIARGIDIDSL